MWKQLLLFVCLALQGVVGAGPLIAGSALNALELEGSTGIVLPSMNLEIRDDVTFEAWIRPVITDNHRENSIVSRGLGEDSITEVLDEHFNIFNTNHLSDFYFHHECDGELTFHMGSGDADNPSGILIQTPEDTITEKWTHVAFTVSTVDGSTTAMVYVDGELVGSQTASFNRQYAVAEQVGLAFFINGRGQRFFTGGLDEVRFWNVARTQEQIRSYKNVPVNVDNVGLVGYYRFNQDTNEDCDQITPEIRTVGSVYVGDVLSFKEGESAHSVLSGVEALDQNYYVSQTGNINQTLEFQLYGHCLDECKSPIEFVILKSDPRVSRGCCPRTPVEVGDVYSSDQKFTFRQTDPMSEDEHFYISFQTRALTFDDEVAVSKAAQARFFVTPSVGCDDVYGSGKEFTCGECGGVEFSCLGCDGIPNSFIIYDDCGVCGGDGSTCTCNPGNATYRGFDESELDKIVLLYELEHAIETMRSLDSQIEDILDEISSVAPEDIHLNSFFDLLSRFDSSCLESFTDNLAELFSAYDF